MPKMYYGPRARRRMGRRGRRNGYPRRATSSITYHGRRGRPQVHVTETNKRFIMVRHPSGEGVKRLYEGSLYAPDRKKRHIKIRLHLS